LIALCDRGGCAVSFRFGDKKPFCSPPLAVEQSGFALERLLMVGSERLLSGQQRRIADIRFRNNPIDRR